MVWALIIAFCLSVTPGVAIAETVDVTDGEGNIVGQQEVSQEMVNPVPDVDLEPIGESLNKLNGTMSDVNTGIGEVSGKLDKLDDVKDGLDDVSEKLEGVSSKVDGLIVSNAEPDPQPVQKLGASPQTFTAYANVSPSGSYASYARQLIPKMGWSDDYVFLQDTSSSYVLVWGDLDYKSAGTITCSDAKFARWYYSGTSAGYLMQSGSGKVTVNLGNYVVLSTCGEYPLLDDGTTLFRQEVAFYAVCAALLFSLRSITDFLLRYHYA